MRHPDTVHEDVDRLRSRVGGLTLADAQRLPLQDQPTDGELAVLTEFATELRKSEGKQTATTEKSGTPATGNEAGGSASDGAAPADPELRVWTRIGHTLLALSRFQFVE